MLTFIQPYIMKTYFGMENPPVNIAKVVIGDGSIGSDAVQQDLPVVRFFTEPHCQDLIQL